MTIFITYLYLTYINVTAVRKTATDVNLDEMVADCMKDTNSDEEPSEEDDPALLVCDA